MVEDQTIRTCKALIPAILVAFASLSSVQAKQLEGGADLLNQYVEARLAEAGSQNERALTIYQDSLKQQPSNVLIAGKAYVRAVENGDWPLIVKAVKSIERSGSMEPEMPLVLFADAFSRKDWIEAESALVKLTDLKNFAFMAPILSNWLDLARDRRSDWSIEKIAENSTAKFYQDDQEILLALATGITEFPKSVQKMMGSRDIRSGPVRVMTARHFLSTRNSDMARQTLAQARTAPEVALLKSIENSTSKETAQEIDHRTGIAFSFQRLATDLGNQRAHFLATLFAQAGIKAGRSNDYGQLVLGRSYIGVKNSEKARTAFREADRSSPYHLTMLNAEIGSFLDDELFEAAEKRLAEEIKADPRKPELHVLLGQTLQSKEEHTKAVEAYSKAIQLAIETDYSNSILANYYLALGSAQEQAGLWPDGLRSLEKANELLPNSASILNYLGYAQLERRENTEEAMEAIRQAHRLRSSSPAITDSLGWGYFIIGNHEKAVEYLEKALAGQPQDPTINEHLGDAYWKVGRKFEARYAWESARLFASAEDLDRLNAKIDTGFTPELVSP